MIVRILAAVLAVGVPGLALAHGEHGGARPLGGSGPVTVQGYQVELLSDPAPPVAGRENRIVAKVFRTSPLAPLAGGRVRIGVAARDAAPVSVPAPEVTWAGSYTTPFSPTRVGDHRVSVVLEEVDGRRLVPPVVVDFRVQVGRAPGPGWPALAAVVLVGALGLYAIRLRRTAVRPPDDRLDLLALPWLRRALTSPLFQPALQVPLLLVAVLVVYLGLADVQDGRLNVATTLTWTIWWAGIIFTFILAGRVWCLACPFGALNEWTSRLSGAWRRLPRVFRNIWWATGLFVLLTWADEQLGVVRSPSVTAWLLVLVAALAVLVGLRYERRSFCRYLCPIGGLIGIYSMTAPIELRARDGAVCRTHGDKECYQGAAGAGRGCPMFEFPAVMDRNNYCTLCAECAKGCSRNNLTLRVRRFGQDLWATRRRLLDEAYLAVALVGLTLLVTAQMLPAWPRWIAVLAGWLPAGARAAVKPVTYLTVMESVVLLGGTLVVAPLLVLAAAVVSERLAGAGRLGLRRTFVTFAYMFVPVGVALHLAHNLSHLLLEGPGIVPAIQRAAALYTPLALGEPDWGIEPLASSAVVGLIEMAVVITFYTVSLLVGHRLSVRVYVDRLTASRALVPFAVLSLLFTAAGIALLNQPMGLRHGM